GRARTRRLRPPGRRSTRWSRRPTAAAPRSSGSASGATLPSATEHLGQVVRTRVVLQRLEAEWQRHRPVGTGGIGCAGHVGPVLDRERVLERGAYEHRRRGAEDLVGAQHHLLDRRVVTRASAVAQTRSQAGGGGLGGGEPQRPLLGHVGAGPDTGPRGQVAGWYRRERVCRPGRRLVVLEPQEPV